jgi:negative regulator of flagellin synthesis FlgM
MPINHIAGYIGAHTQRSGENSQVLSNRDGTKGGQANGVGAAVAADTVSLTDTSSRLRRLESRLAALPEVDNDRVAQIRQSIADGTFEINPARIATRMLAMEQELGR